ncbi:contractile injection system protein, VgrG/Pvc8 family, partial [Nocardioides sp.]|uniref:contractile injection system protein, VgrG/Pvc8 family n=1 Tax=Nocardioides sp. TaxID=35761 RepID=UPI00273698E8
MPSSSSATTTALAPVIKVNGSALNERWLDQLTVLRIDRALGTVGRTTLRFVDVGYGLSSSRLFRLGAEVQIEKYGGRDPLFKGEVTGLSLEQSMDAVPELIVTVDDPAHRLSRGTRTRTFLHASYADVVRTLGGDNGVSVTVTARQGLGTVHEYQLQACSDLAYLNHIVERTGTSWWIGNDGKLTVDSPADVAGASISLSLGESLQRFSVRASDLHPRKVAVTGWDPDQQQQVTGNASSTRSAESDFVADFPGRRAASGPVLAQVADHSPLNDTEATHLASALLTEAATSAVVARGTCVVEGSLGPAASVQVTDAGPASGTYRVTAVQHVYSAAGFLTHFTAGPYRPSGLVDLVSPRRTEATGSLDGLVPGVVTDVADPDKIGRVKVKYPAAGGEIDSPWA